MEIYSKLAILVIGLLKLSECDSYSESINNSTSNEINFISGENNTSTVNSNYTDIQIPTTASTNDNFKNTSSIEDHGLENLTVKLNTVTTNTSSRENTSAPIDNDIKKLFHEVDNEVVTSGSDQNTRDDTNYMHSSYNITKLNPRRKPEESSEIKTAYTFESKETNNMAHKQAPTYNSSTTDRQETTLSEEEYYSTKVDAKKTSSVTDDDLDYDDYSYEETTVVPLSRITRINLQNATISKTLNGSKLRKTKVKISNHYRSRDKIKTPSPLKDLSELSIEVIKSLKGASDYSAETVKAVLSENVGSLKKDDDILIDQVEKDVLAVTEKNTISEIEILKKMTPKTWIPDDRIKSFLNETLDKLSSVSTTTLTTTDNHTNASKTATDSETDSVTQKQVTIKIDDEIKATATVKPSNNLVTKLKNDQQWDDFLSKNAEEIIEFEKMKYNTKTVLIPPVTKVETNSVTSLNNNSSQMVKVVKPMNADYMKFPNDSATITTTTKLETISVKTHISNSSQTEKYPKSKKNNKYHNNSITSKRNSKCPYAKAVGEFNLNKLTGYLQTVYYTMQEKITCFKILMIKLSEEEKKQYRKIYGDFHGRINWTRCDFEIKAETKLKRKHFLQNTGVPDGVYENKIVVVDSDGAADLDLLPTLIDEDPDQWTAVNNLVFMRDCKSGRVLIFKRNPREKVSLKELKEALFAAGEGFNGRLSCRRKDPNRSDSF